MATFACIHHGHVEGDRCLKCVESVTTTIRVSIDTRKLIEEVTTARVRAEAMRAHRNAIGETFTAAHEALKSAEARLLAGEHAAAAWREARLALNRAMQLHGAASTDEDATICEFVSSRGDVIDALARDLGFSPLPRE